MTSEFIQKSAEATREAYQKVVEEEVDLGEVKSSKISFAKYLEEFNQQPPRTIVMVYFIIYRLSKDSKDVAGNAIIALDTDNDESFEEEQRSYMAEIGNILIGAYLSSLSDLSGDNLRVSAPLQAVLKGSTSEAAKILEHQLFRGDKEDELFLAEISLQNKVRTSLHVFLRDG